ncbi:hypothetical protein [Streptomyces sp. NPDC095613]
MSVGRTPDVLGPIVEAVRPRARGPEDDIAWMSHTGGPHDLAADVPVDH